MFSAELYFFLEMVQLVGLIFFRIFQNLVLEVIIIAVIIRKNYRVLRKNLTHLKSVEPRWDGN